MLKFISRFNRRRRPSILKNNQLLFFPPKEFITSLLLYNIFLIIIYMKKISQFWLAESSAVLTKYSAKIENTVQFEILTIFVIKHIVLLLSFWQMFFRQSELNKFFCTNDANVSLNFQIKTWSHPLRTQYSYALYPTYCFNSSSTSDGGFMCREKVLYIEHSNKAFNKEKTKALLVYSISSILMKVIIVYPS